MKKLIGLSLVVLLLLAGCSNSTQGNASGSNKLQVVTTFYPMYYFTQKIAGSAADVSLLIPNGVEPHDWEPKASDMAKIQDAGLFVYNSEYMETWVPKVMDSIDQSKLKVVEAAKGISLMNADNSNSESSAAKDPHVWLSPVLAQTEVDNIAKGLEQKDPKHATEYEKNAAALKKQLANLDSLYKTTIEKAKKKEFVTQHAAFGYLAKQYGLTQIPIAGLSPDVEPSLGKLAELAKLTKKKDIKIIYFEGLTSSKVAETLANEIGAQTEVLNPLEGLTKQDQDKGLDYIGVMKSNLNALEKTLDQ